MIAKRLRMLAVFAGGCLSGSVLIVVWRGNAEPSASSARRAEPARELAVASAFDEAPRAADVETSPHEEVAPAAPSPPAASKPAERSADPSADEAGRAVADVLAHLEAAYRQNLAEASPAADTPPKTEVSAPVQAQPESAALAQIPSREAPSSEPPAALAAVAAPVAPLAPALAPLSSAYARPVAEPAAALAPAARNPAPPTANPTVAAVPPVGASPPVAVVPQNVHIGDTHNGNTYQVQQIIQYVPMPMYAAYPYGGYPAPAPTPHSGAPKRVPYPSTLTNPDNPWGYDFPSALWTVR